MKINYSQSNLQTYIACPRKFELKYILKRVWPAIQSEPILQLEDLMRQGNQFHLMVQQYFSSVDPDLISQQIKNNSLKNWWNSFLAFSNQISDYTNQSEINISANLDGKRIIGVFDLLSYSNNGKFIIIDWKTNQHKPPKKFLEQQIQTRLYPLLLTLSGQQWNKNERISPSQIEMIYWFSNDPESPESFLYSEQQHEQDKEYFTQLINQIETTKIGEFPLTTNEKLCNFCQYRSLCNRGIKPGQFDEQFVDLENIFEEISDFDINQIGEIAF
jgi:CRISPR/Cas system-associated exonuclease Cas4 (RecB family)